MKNRTVIAILAVAGLLTTYIALFELESMTTTELEERKNRVFLNFRRGDVDALTLVSTAGERTELEKKAPKIPGAEPRWVVASAGGIAADETEVRGVLSAIDYLLVDRAVTGQGVQEDPRYGLKPPRLRGSFRIGDKTTEFIVGAEALGEKVYLAAGDRPGSVFAVAADFLESVDKSTTDLRSKRIVEEDLDRTTAVHIAVDGREISFEKKDGAWEVTAGGLSVMAARDEVQKLLRAVSELRAESFEADGEVEAVAAAAGLDNPWARVAVELPGGEEVALRIGGACEGTDGRKSMTEGLGTVVCIGPDLPALLERRSQDYWEMIPAPVDLEEVVSVAVAAGGERLTLVKEEPGRWSSDPEAPFAIGAEAIRELLELVTQTKAASVHTGEDAKHAFGGHVGSLDIRTVEGVPDVRLEILAPGPEGLVGVRRGTEDIVLAAAGSIGEKLSANPLAYRKRSFEVCEPDEVTRIEIDAEVDQTLEKRGDGWWLVSPIELRADDAAVGRLVKELAAPKVEMWVPVDGSRRLGLEKSAGFGRVAVVCSGGQSRGGGEGGGETGPEDAQPQEPRRLEFVFGLPVESGVGVYAAVDTLEAGVAFVSSRITRYLESPLVQRDLLSVAPEELESVTIEAADAAVKITRVDGAWEAEPASRFDASRFDRLLIDMSAMRIVTAVSYGEKPPQRAATARLSFETAKKDEPPMEMWIGPMSDDPEVDGYLARRGDVPVTVVVPARIIDGFLEAAGLR